MRVAKIQVSKFLETEDHHSRNIARVSTSDTTLRPE